MKMARYNTRKVWHVLFPVRFAKMWSSFCGLQFHDIHSDHYTISEYKDLADPEGVVRPACQNCRRAYEAQA